MKIVSKFMALAVAALLLAAMIGCAPPVTGPWEDQYTVTLEGNPTTGYEWTYTMSRDGIVKEASNDYTQDAAGEGMVGVGGTYTFVFEGVAAGDVTLTFTYDRPWGSDGPPQTQTYKLRVNDAGQIAQLG
jgi:predicted secreted protein